MDKPLIVPFSHFEELFSAPEIIEQFEKFSGSWTAGESVPMEQMIINLIGEPPEKEVMTPFL